MFGPQASLFAGLGVGYLWVFGCLNCLNTSNVKIVRMEEKGPFACLKNISGFKKVNTALVNDPALNAEAIR